MRAHRVVWNWLGIGCSSGTRVPSPIAAQVRPGIEVLLSDSAHLIAGKRLGLLTNNTGVDHLGRRDVDLLRTAFAVPKIARGFRTAGTPPRVSQSTVSMADRVPPRAPRSIRSTCSSS